MLRNSYGKTRETTLTSHITRGTENAFRPVMRHKFRHVLLVLSLMLCLVSIALWIRSAFATDEVDFPCGPFHAHLSLFPAIISTEIKTGKNPWGPEWGYFRINPIAPLRVVWSQSFMGFEYQPTLATVYDGVHTGVVSRGVLFWVPLYAPILVFGSFPAWLIIRNSRRKRRRCATGCKTCRYDLTGNMSGVCPECGTAIHNRMTSQSAG